MLATPGRKIACTLCAITTIALTLTACNQTADTHDADVKAIQDNEAQWNQDWAAKDQDKIMAHYADDAILIISGSPSSSGKEAIRTALKPMVADPALSHQENHFRPTAVGRLGDLPVQALDLGMAAHEEFHGHGDPGGERTADFFRHGSPFAG